MKMNNSTYAKIANLVGAIQNAKGDNNNHWMTVREENLQGLITEKLPSGSGFDSGTKLIMEKSSSDKLVFKADFHHMDDNGFYCGWSEHEVIVTPCFDGVHIRVTGRNKRHIKDYIANVFYAIE